MGEELDDVCEEEGVCVWKRRMCVEEKGGCVRKRRMCVDRPYA